MGDVPVLTRPAEHCLQLSIPKSPNHSCTTTSECTAKVSHSGDTGGVIRDLASFSAQSFNELRAVGSCLNGDELRQWNQAAAPHVSELRFISRAATVDASSAPRQSTSECLHSSWSPPVRGSQSTTSSTLKCTEYAMVRQPSLTPDPVLEHPSKSDLPTLDELYAFCTAASPMAFDTSDVGHDVVITPHSPLSHATQSHMYDEASEKAVVLQENEVPLPHRASEQTVLEMPTAVNTGAGHKSMPAPVMLAPFEIPDSMINITIQQPPTFACQRRDSRVVDDLNNFAGQLCSKANSSGMKSHRVESVEKSESVHVNEATAKHSTMFEEITNQMSAESGITAGSSVTSWFETITRPRERNTETSKDACDPVSRHDSRLPVHTSSILTSHVNPDLGHRVPISFADPEVSLLSSQQRLMVTAEQEDVRNYEKMTLTELLPAVRAFLAMTVDRPVNTNMSNDHRSISAKTSSTQTLPVTDKECGVRAADPVEISSSSLDQLCRSYERLATHRPRLLEVDELHRTLSAVQLELDKEREQTRQLNDLVRELDTCLQHKHDIEMRYTKLLDVTRNSEKLYRFAIRKYADLRRQLTIYSGQPHSAVGSDSDFEWMLENEFLLMTAYEREGQVKPENGMKHSLNSANPRSSEAMKKETVVLTNPVRNVSVLNSTRNNSALQPVSSASSFSTETDGSSKAASDQRRQPKVLSFSSVIEVVKPSPMPFDDHETSGRSSSASDASSIRSELDSEKTNDKTSSQMNRSHHNNGYHQHHHNNHHHHSEQCHQDEQHRTGASMDEDDPASCHIHDCSSDHGRRESHRNRHKIDAVGDRHIEDRTLPSEVDVEKGGHRKKSQSEKHTKDADKSIEEMTSTSKDLTDGSKCDTGKLASQGNASERSLLDPGTDFTQKIKMTAGAYFAAEVNALLQKKAAAAAAIVGSKTKQKVNFDKGHEKSVDHDRRHRCINSSDSDGERREKQLTVVKSTTSAPMILAAGSGSTKSLATSKPHKSSSEPVGGMASRANGGPPKSSTDERIRRTLLAELSRHVVPMQQIAVEMCKYCDEQRQVDGNSAELMAQLKKTIQKEYGILTK